MSIQIRLDVPALERLIGGSEEWAVELRRGVVEEFAKRHLIAVVKDQTFQKFLGTEAKAAREALDESFRKHLGDTRNRGWSSETCNLSNSAREAIDVHAKAMLDKALADAVERVWKAKFEARLEEVVDRLVFSRLCSAIDERMKKLSTEEVDARVKAKLTAAAAMLAKGAGA